MPSEAPTSEVNGPPRTISTPSRTTAKPTTWFQSSGCWSTLIWKTRKEDGELGQAAQLRSTEAGARADPVARHLEAVLEGRNRPRDEDGLRHAPAVRSEVKVPGTDHHTARSARSKQQRRQGGAWPVDMVGHLPGRTCVSFIKFLFFSSSYTTEKIPMRSVSLADGVWHAATLCTSASGLCTIANSTEREAELGSRTGPAPRHHH